MQKKWEVAKEWLQNPLLWMAVVCFALAAVAPFLVEKFPPNPDPFEAAMSAWTIFSVAMLASGGLALTGVLIEVRPIIRPDNQ